MNIAAKIEQHLSQQSLALIKLISNEATSLGQTVYLVGGVVRDTLLGYPNFDLDIVSEGDAIKLARRIAETTGLKPRIHSRFGTAKISQGKLSLDLATARCETYNRPGALPSVTPNTIQADLSRRDFSINAMAIRLNQKYYGDLLDPHHGKEDLEHNLIRILHPQGFTDDATRILRAVRYEQRLNFKIEPETAHLLQRDIPMLDTISGDRLRHELLLTLQEQYPEKIIGRLGELGVLQQISLPIEDTAGINNTFNIARQVNKSHNLPWLYLCLLIYKLSKAQLNQFAFRLKIAGRLKNILQDTIDIKEQLPLLDNPQITNSDIYHILLGRPPLAIQANIISSQSLAPSLHLQLFLDKLRYVKPLLSGEDIKQFGIPSGTKIGTTLKLLLKAKLNGEITTRQEEEKLVSRLYPTR